MNSQEQKTALTRSRLLKAALEVFAEAGIAGATTKASIDSSKRVGAGFKKGFNPL